MTDDERSAALDAIAAEVAVCKRCRLHEGRTRAVPGEGSAATEVMFVGEGPGFNEDRQGRPFVGRAGDLLEKLLESIHWTRDEVFITNFVKCRPPDNRDPEPDEMAACAPYLARQLSALDPALVVTLGRFSMGRFRPGAKISQVHGTFVPAADGSSPGDALTLSLYHPAAALRQASLEDALFEDFQAVPAALIESRKRRETGHESSAERSVAAEVVEQPSPSVQLPMPAAAAPADNVETSAEPGVDEPPTPAPWPEGSRGGEAGPEQAQSPRDQSPSDQPPGDSNQTSQLSLF